MYGKPCSAGVAAIVLFATIVTAHADGPSAGFALPYGAAEFETVATPIQAQDRSFDLLAASVTDIQQAVAAGALTYEKLVQLYLNRIEAYNKKGPQLNAVIAINPHALETARALDTERLTKGIRSPLHVIPIAIKDNIDVFDIPSAGGNLAFAGTYPARDATVVRKLREAGAIIFFKTNMDELALGSNIRD
jgi:amidase